MLPIRKPTRLTIPNNFTISMLIVVFVLVIIVMMYPTPHRGYGPDLPKVYHVIALRGADRSDALKVSVTRDGIFYIGNDLVEEKLISTKLQAKLSQGAERKLYIIADARARYRAVSKALDAARDAGIEQVAFLAEQRKPAATYNP